MPANEQPVAFRPSEADVRAVFGKSDDADRLARRTDDLHAGSRSGPEITVGVAAHAVSGGGGVCAWDLEPGEALTVAGGFAVELPGADFTTGPSVGYVELFVIR